jgi:hypothetical protein
LVSFQNPIFGSFKSKAIQMRKLLAILMVAGIITACGDDTGTTTPDEDSTRPPNTLSPADTSTVAVDTSRRVADTTIKK